MTQLNLDLDFDSHCFLCVEDPPKMRGPKKCVICSGIAAHFSYWLASIESAHKHTSTPKEALVNMSISNIGFSPVVSATSCLATAISAIKSLDAAITASDFAGPVRMQTRRRDDDGSLLVSVAGHGTVYVIPNATSEVQKDFRGRVALMLAALRAQPTVNKKCPLDVSQIVVSSAGSCVCWGEIYVKLTSAVLTERSKLQHFIDRLARVGKAKK